MRFPPNQARSTYVIPYYRSPIVLVPASLHIGDITFTDLMRINYYYIDCASPPDLFNEAKVRTNQVPKKMDFKARYNTSMLGTQK